MGIPPISAPGIFGGQPTCPQGYYYDPGTQMCLPIAGSPTAVPIKVTAWGLSSNEIDPVQAAKNTGVGLAASGLIGQLVAAFWHAMHLDVPGAINSLIGAYDDAIALTAEFVSASNTRNTPGFWDAIGSLLSDLLGITLNGATLYSQLATRGTLPAMQAVGGSLIDLLIGEFTGTATGTGGQITYSSNPDPATGLPPATLSPIQGLNGAKAIMGFVLTSAVRQANVDGLMAVIPYGLGEPFMKYSEGIRTNLGIGRMMRFALKPIFQDLIATPLKWAINTEYSPTLLSPADAYRAFDQQVFTADQLHQELARHGYSADRYSVLQWQGRSLPSREELRVLHVTGLLNDNDYLIWMRRGGYTDDVTAMLDQYEDIKPLRGVALAEVERAALKYLAGAMPGTQYQDIVNSMATRVGGSALLSAGEVSNMLNAPSITLGSGKHVNIGLSTLTAMYEDGLITLQEYQDALTTRGYSADQQSELVLLLLVKAKAAAEKAAAAAAKAAAASAAAAPVTTPTPTTPPTSTTPGT